MITMMSAAGREKASLNGIVFDLRYDAKDIARFQFIHILFTF